MKARYHKFLFPVLISISVVAILSVGLWLIIKSTWTEISANPTITDTAEQPYNFDYSWTKHLYIAHALGGILGDSYTNSTEAFLLNYQLGQRVFEIDLTTTVDGQIVAAHGAEDWLANSTIPSNATANSQNHPAEFTYDNFMSSLWLNKYHPADLATLFKLMEEHPDIYIITDTKYTDEATVREQFTEIVKKADSINSSLLDRLIIQIYHPEMLDWIMDVHPWKSVIYTLYANPDWTPENVLKFSRNSGVKYITLWASWLTSEISQLWSQNEIKIGVHTVNNWGEANNLFNLGATNIYTDFLLTKL